MTDPNNSPPNGPTSRRRSSFAGQAFADLFGGGRNRASIVESSSSPPGQYAGPITAAAAQANQRRLTLATSGLGNGLNGSPPGTGTYFGGRARGDSVSSSNNASVDESAIEEDATSAGASQPTSPFARRVSFGARALRDLRPGGTGGGGNNGESGFNWADNMRTRAERTSIGGAGMGASPNTNHVRAKSIATMEQQPVRTAPKPAPLDHTQERILKGDFYMD
ncbi:hypothetical protein BDV97DRAFT_289826 [Delphinella strobiligena]|nr:hypothetical protein BDV97DRAFT_289826 [Delphinella strobiligena]